MRILVSGAGIAGPAFAWAVAGRGFDVTVIERAPALRDGGQAVDFRGPVHREVLERLGLWGPIHERRTPGTDLVLLDRAGNESVRLPSVMMSGDVEIVRGDLSRLLYERTAASAEYRFGVHLTSIEPEADGARVTLSNGVTERYDLVVGADGLHSGVRALAFGDEALFLRHHGYRLATFGVSNPLGLAGKALTYTVPGRSLMVSSYRAQMIFAGGPLGRERWDADAMRAMIVETYRDAGWQTARVLEALAGARDLYVDQIATVAIERYSRGPVALLGDAAWGGTLGGQGTPLAIVGAYVLAGELASSPRDLPAALARFEAHMRPYASKCQKGAERAGSFFAPRTKLGLFARDAFYKAFTSRLLIKRFEKMVKASAESFALPSYPQATTRPDAKRGAAAGANFADSVV